MGRYWSLLSNPVAVAAKPDHAHSGWQHRFTGTAVWGGVADESYIIGVVMGMGGAINFAAAKEFRGFCGSK